MDENKNTVLEVKQFLKERNSKGVKTHINYFFSSERLIFLKENSVF